MINNNRMRLQIKNPSTNGGNYRVLKYFIFTISLASPGCFSNEPSTVAEYVQELNTEGMTIGNGIVLMVSDDDEKWLNETKNFCIRKNWTANTCKERVLSYKNQETIRIEAKSKADAAAKQKLEADAAAKEKALGY